MKYVRAGWCAAALAALFFWWRAAGSEGFAKGHSDALAWRVFGVAAFALTVVLAIYFKEFAERFTKKKLNYVILPLAGIIFGINAAVMQYASFLGEDGSYQGGAAAVGLSGAILFASAAAGALALMLHMEGGQKREVKLKVRPAVIFMIIFAVMAAVTIVFLFATFYPGGVCSDSENQLGQLMGVEEVTNHHPYWHTRFLGIFFLPALAASGNVNAAAAFTTTAQILIVSAIFAYMMMTLYEAGVHWAVVAGGSAFFTFLPPHLYMRMMIWKDTLFTFVIMLMLTAMYRLMRGIGKKWPAVVFFALGGAGTCLFRSNGLLVFLALVFFIALFGLKKNKQMLVAAGGVLAFALFMKFPMLAILGVRQPDRVESLSIPLQQIARTLSDDGPLPDSDMEFLNNFIDTDAMVEERNSEISDYLKNLVRWHGDQDYLNEHLGEFISLWIRTGLAHPGAYLAAYADQTFGYAVPADYYWNIYWMIILECSIDISQPQSTIDATESLKGLRDWYSTNPRGMLWVSVGLAGWFLAALFVAGILGRSRKLLFTVPAAGLVLTLLLATPMANEFRYGYPLLPILFFAACIYFLRGSKGEELERFGSIENNAAGAANEA